MELYKVEIPKKLIEALPENELLFFIQAGTALNEIYTLHKLTLFSNKNVKTEVERRAQNSQSFFLLTILTGKLSESWKLLEKLYFGGKLSKEYVEFLPDDAKESLDKLKRYFGKDNLINNVRNTVSSHYDFNEIKKNIEKISEDEPFEIYISPSRGNCFYYASNMITMITVLEMTDEASEPLKALDTFFKEVCEVAEWFLNFFNHCLMAMAKKNGWENRLITEKVEIPEPSKVDDIFIPCFLKKPEKE